MNENTTMNRTIYLSRSERRIGSRYFLRFSALNGLGISFLGDATVTLLAIHFGAGNMMLGLISSMIHISGIILLVVPRIFRGRNVVTVAFWAWMIRGLVGLPYAALVFMEGRRAVALIIILYALFCLARTAGVAMVTTLQKRLVVSRTESDVVFRNAMSFQGTQIISRVISFLVLSVRKLAELTGLLLLPMLGIVANTLAALTIRRIPNRTRVDYSPGENLFVIFRRNMAVPQCRRILILRWISLAQTILFAMAVPFLRRSADQGPAAIFLYTIAVSLGSFLSSISLRPIANRAGSRPLLFFTAIPGILFFLIWTFIPETISLEIFAITGFLTMYALNASNLAANRLLVSITPEEGAVGFNSMETFITSILALVLGFGAGFLADLSQRLSGATPVNPYGLVFLPAALGSALQVRLAMKIDEPGSLGLAESARIISNLGNLRTWQTLSNLENTADPVKRRTLVHSMGHSRAPVAASEIGKILAEPLSLEKGDLIDALFHTRRPELVDFLCEEALEPAAFHRGKAIFALGAYPGPKVEQTLEKLLDNDDPQIRSLAAKSLGRIGSRKHIERIQRYWEAEWRLRERLDYMIALFHMDTHRRYIDDLFSGKISAAGVRTERTLFTLLSRQFGMSPPLGFLYREEIRGYGRGVDLLLEESRDTPFLLEQGEILEDLWEVRDYEGVWRLCRKALESAAPPEDVRPVARALVGFPEGTADEANALAALYFSYQLLTAEAAT